MTPGKFCVVMRAAAGWTASSPLRTNSKMRPAAAKQCWTQCASATRPSIGSHGITCGKQTTSRGTAAAMLLTYRPGSAVPDRLILVFKGADEEFKCAPHHTGQLLVAGTVQNGAKGKGGCLPISPVLWAASFADVGLSRRGAPTSAGSTGSSNSCRSAP